MVEYRKMIFDHHQMQLFYQVQGQGTPLILLHGFLEDHTIWEAMSANLRSKHTLISIDLPGHGRSALAAEILDMDAVAEAILALMDTLDFENFAVMGHSMGGYVALAMLELQPQRLEAIYLVNSTSAADTDDRRLERDRACTALGRRPEIFIRLVISNLFPLSVQSDYQDTIDLLSKKAQTFPVTGLQAAVKGMKLRLDRSAALTEFSGIKVIFAGLQDSLLSFDTLENISQHTGCQLIELNGGHMGWIENTAEIVKKVLFNE